MAVLKERATKEKKKELSPLVVEVIFAESGWGVKGNVEGMPKQEAFKSSTFLLGS